MYRRGRFSRATHGHRRANLALRGGPPEPGGLARLVARAGLGLGALLLAVGSVGAVSHVERTYGGHYSAVPARPSRVVVADLAANRRARGTSPPGLARWREAARAEGVEIEHVIVESLAGLDVDRYGAIVLPGQERLADAEWDRVLALLRDGVGLIFTGHPGLQHRNGKQRERVLLESLLPGAVFKRIRRPAGVLRVALGGPLTAGLAPGERVELSPGRSALALRGPGSLAWGAQGGALDAAEAAMVHGRVEQGPLVWLSPDVSWFSDAARAERLLRNALRYALHEPVLELRPWPGGATAAALVGADPAALAELLEAGLAQSNLPEPQRLDGDADRRLARLLTWLGAVEHEGGLYALADGSAWLAGEERGGLEAALRKELGMHNVWLTRAPELARWSRERQGLRAELEVLAPGHARIILHNAGAAAVEHATARVYLPPGARPPMRVEVSWFVERPLLHVDSAREWVDLIAPEIPPGESARYSFRY